MLRMIYNETFRFVFDKSGSHLLSHAVSSIVPSAAYVLTVVFGMGTGVSRKRIATRIVPPSLRSDRLRPLSLSPGTQPHSVGLLQMLRFSLVS